MATLLDAPPAPSRAPEAPPSRTSLLLGRIVTALLVIGPLVALAVAVPLLWGQALHLRDVVIAGGVLPRERLRRHRRLPPTLHASQLPSRALAQDHARVGRFARGRRFARRLGREPPSPPCVQRQAGRSALAAPARHGRTRAAPRLLPRARRLAVQGRRHVGDALRPRSARRRRRADHQPALSRVRDLLARRRRSSSAGRSRARSAERSPRSSGPGSPAWCCCTT